MSSTTIHSSRSPSEPSRIPPLQNGDRLTRAEFEKRYDATPGLKKAELIEGVVYMAPPVSHTYHSYPHARFGAWLAYYCASTPQVIPGDNGSLRLDLDNMPQPDVYMMLSPEFGGQAEIDEDGYVVGAPELIGEIAASSVSYDLHAKMNVYRRGGVREYVVWRTIDGEIDYFVLRDGAYERMIVDADGIFKSQVFPGLWLDPAAMLKRDLGAVLRVVQQGTASTEHVAFLAKLNSRKAKS